MKNFALMCILTYMLMGYNSAFSQVSQSKYVKIDYRKDFLLNPSETAIIKDHLGETIDKTILHSIKAQDIEHIIEPFRHRNEKRWWQTEFWGKWMLSAAKAYEYTQDPQLFEMMKNSTKEIIATQSKNGYIGNYALEYHLKQWDIWGRKYTMLGLLYYYDLTGDKKVLKAAERLAGHLMTEVGPGKTNIVLTGNYRGMASSSILEPIVLLYERTAKEKYLEFAKYIVNSWETPDGPQLISKALNNIPVSERFTDFKEWWSWGNGQKAYEMMSCYDGLLRLYQITGEQQYLEAVRSTVKSIQEEEINIVGSGASMECWFKGKHNQFFPAEHTMETCVTMTWMKLCYELFRLTGEWQLVEEIERSAYNNLLGSLMPDGHRFSKYSGLQGFRDYDVYQCNMKINCCMANGPRGLVLLPDLAVMNTNREVWINLYNAGSSEVELPDDQHLEITLETSYPKEGKIQILLNPEDDMEFDLKLRIPSWSTATKININGNEINQMVVPGSYLTLNRKWTAGDHVDIEFDMRGRIIEHKEGIRTYIAVMRGPIVLARDNRFGDYFVDAGIVPGNIVDKKINLDPVMLKGVWMGYKTIFKYGAGENPVEIEIPLVDFSSAGNQWDPMNRYRVWMPVIYNPIKANNQ